jgi:flagellar biosynthesis protein FliQ
MDLDQVMVLGRDAMLVTLLLSAPMLLSGMLVGLLISIFQSVTQIQEITLSFVPKIFFVMLTFVLFLPWMVSTMKLFVVPLFSGLHEMI